MGRRAIARISGAPGKTRTANVYEVEGAYYFLDLPGYGYARTSKQERAGFRALLEGCLTHREALTGVVWLLDIRHAPSRDDRAMGALLAAREVPVLIALTKADKVPPGQRRTRRRALAEATGVPEDQCILTSAKTKLGIPDLRDSIEALAR